MSEETSNVRKVTIQDKEYDENALPSEVQQLIAIYRKWTNEVAEARLEVTKIDAAIKELSREVVSRIDAAGIKPLQDPETESKSSE